MESGWNTVNLEGSQVEVLVYNDPDIAGRIVCEVYNDPGEIGAGNPDGYAEYNRLSGWEARNRKWTHSYNFGTMESALVWSMRSIR